jgi:dihydrodipicolinate synthase/N-acetylneuraminate lyase
MLFPAGIPALWCPLLTHYRDNGVIDLDRMSAHLAYLSPWVKGYLIPGSTGDGWELNEEETLALAQWAIGKGRASGTSMLLGVLRAQTQEMLATLHAMLALIRRTTGANDPHEALTAAGVCGFAVCPPRGNSLSQQEIQAGFSRALDEGLPMALYQLP